MRNKIILDNLGLIYKAMIDLHCNTTDEEQRDEYFYAGLLGLYNAIDTFDETKNTKPSTYYYKCITNKIKQLFKHKTIQKNGELRDLSLNIQVRGVDLEDLIPSNNDLMSEVIKSETKEIIHKALNKLKNTKYKEYLQEYYGINREQLNMREMARKYGVSHQCIQQNVQTGLKRMRKIIEKEFKYEKD